MPPPPTRDDIRLFGSAAEFRSWLESNHDALAEQWIGFYKRGASRTGMTYAESVDEALCFGWIDGLTRRIDDDVYAIRFTPRRRRSNWSAVNIAKVADLAAAGRMHPAGIRAFEERDRRKDAIYSHERPEVELSPDFVARFEADDAAWSFWQSRAPSFRRQATHWVMSAKRAETRERRFTTLMAESRAGRLPAPFIVTRAEP